MIEKIKGVDSCKVCQSSCWMINTASSTFASPAWGPACLPPSLVTYSAESRRGFLLAARRIGWLHQLGLKKMVEEIFVDSEGDEGEAFLEAHEELVESVDILLHTVTVGVGINKVSREPASGSLASVEDERVAGYVVNRSRVGAQEVVKLFSKDRKTVKLIDTSEAFPKNVDKYNGKVESAVESKHVYSQLAHDYSKFVEYGAWGAKHLKKLVGVVTYDKNVTGKQNVGNPVLRKVDNQPKEKIDMFPKKNDPDQNVKVENSLGTDNRNMIEKLCPVEDKCVKTVQAENSQESRIETRGYDKAFPKNDENKQKGVEIEASSRIVEIDKETFGKTGDRDHVLCKVDNHPMEKIVEIDKFAKQLEGVEVCGVKREREGGEDAIGKDSLECISGSLMSMEDTRIARYEVYKPKMDVQDMADMFNMFNKSGDTANPVDTSKTCSRYAAEANKPVQVVRNENRDVVLFLENVDDKVANEKANKAVGERLGEEVKEKIDEKYVKFKHVQSNYVKVIDAKIDGNRSVEAEKLCRDKNKSIAEKTR